MDPQTYAQMLALQQQQGAPLTTQGQPNPPTPRVPKYDANNPLSEGSMKAVNAARQSMSGQKSGIMHDILGMADRFAIARLRGSSSLDGRALGQAFKTPEETAAENYQMMQFLQAQEALKQEQAYRQQKMMQDNAYRYAALEEQRRAHNMTGASQAAHAEYYRALTENARGENKNQAMIDAKTEKLQSMIPGAIPYEGRTAAERSAFTKELRERANKPHNEIKVLHSLDKITDIVNEYPDLSTDAAAAMFPGKYQGGIRDTIALKSMPHKKRVALEKLTKLSNDLIIKQIHGLGGQRASIFLEKIMQSSNPHYGLTPDAVRAIRDNFKEEYDRDLLDGKIARKALQGNYYVPMMEPEYSEIEHEESLNTPSITESDISKMSPELISKILNAKLGEVIK